MANESLGEITTFNMLLAFITSLTILALFFGTLHYFFDTDTMYIDTFWRILILSSWFSIVVGVVIYLTERKHIEIKK